MREMSNNINIATHRIAASADDVQLSLLVLTPTHTDPRAIVQIVHGMCEHKERYIDFMQFLCLEGYICVAHDHRGHGESIRSEHDLGYFYQGGYRALIDDTLYVTRWAKSLFPSLELYLFGHSMGSMVVRSYTKRYDNELAGLIVCGSPSYNAGCLAGRWVAQLIAKVKGERHRSGFVQQLAFGSYNRNFKSHTALSPNAWICSNNAIVEAYDRDSKCNFTFTANGFYNLFGLMRDTYSCHHWAMQQPQLPIAFVAGANDPCIISPKHFEKSVEAMHRVGYTHIERKLYPNMRHEILNETNKQQVWDDILDTLNRWQSTPR